MSEHLSKMLLFVACFSPIVCLVCVCVLGIESLVRSLKEAVQLSNLEAPKQGFLLLTEILERCAFTKL